MNIKKLYIPIWVMVCVFGYVLFGEEFLINAIIGGFLGVLTWLFFPSEKKNDGVVTDATNIQAQAKDVEVLKTQTSSNSTIHRSALTVGVLVIAFSVLFHLVISPILKERRFTSCLEGVDLQKAEADAHNASIQTKNGDRETVSEWKDRIANFQTINVEKLKEECYRLSL